MMYKDMHKHLGDKFIYMDKRKIPEHKYRGWERSGYTIKEVKPMILADMKHLPFRNNLFSAIIFDPPHLDIGLTSFMGERYGIWSTADIVRHLRACNVEFPRVLKANGILIMKVLAKKWRLYETLLRNFTFFLPITYKSKSHLSHETVGWYIALTRSSYHNIKAKL